MLKADHYPPDHYPLKSHIQLIVWLVVGSSLTAETLMVATSLLTETQPTQEEMGRFRRIDKMYRI